MTSLVSVIIPCYNAAPWIEETLHCVTSQSHSNLEVIVVDDGSTDETWAALQRFVDPRIRLFKQPNAGAATARNVGLENARGTFIQFLDADDLMSPGKIAAQLLAAENLGPNWVFAARWGRFRLRIEQTHWGKLWSPARQTGIDWLVNAWAEGDMMPLLGWLIPRALADAVGPWNPAAGITDDAEYFTRVLLQSAGVVQVPEAQVYYRSGNMSYSQRTDSWAWESLLNSYELCSYHLLRAEDSLRVRKAVASRIRSFQYQAYPAFPHLVERAELLLDTLKLPKGLPHGGGPASKLVGRLLGWKVSRRLGIARASLRDVTERATEKND